MYVHITKWLYETPYEFCKGSFLFPSSIIIGTLPLPRFRQTMLLFWCSWTLFYTNTPAGGWRGRSNPTCLTTGIISSQIYNNPISLIIIIGYHGASTYVMAALASLQDFYVMLDCLVLVYLGSKITVDPNLGTHGYCITQWIFWVNDFSERVRMWRSW